MSAWGRSWEQRKHAVARVARLARAALLAVASACSPPTEPTNDPPGEPVVTSPSACLPAGAVCDPASPRCCTGTACQPSIDPAQSVCCLEAQSTCTETSDCCAPSVCANGVCAPPPPACLDNGAACTGGECCDPLVCTSGTCQPPTSTCHAAGAPCADPSECCAGAACGTTAASGAATVCCGRSGASCADVTECCGALRCAGGTCQL